MFSLFFFLWSWIVPVSQATTMFYLNDSQQASLSDAVVVAQIGTSKTSPHPDYPTIMTETTILVEEVLLGEAPSTLQIRQIGGKYNGKTLYLPGDARLELGSKVVLFLNQENGTWYLTALDQSKYDLENRGRMGWILKKRYHDGMVYQDEKGKLRPFTPPTTPPIQSLRNFRAKMRTLKGATK